MLRKVVVVMMITAQRTEEEKGEGEGAMNKQLSLSLFLSFQGFSSSLIHSCSYFLQQEKQF